MAAITRIRTALIVPAAILLAAGIAGLTALSGMGAEARSASQPIGQPDLQVENQSCLACHATPGMQIELSSGEIRPLTINPDTFENSVHGELGYACVQCHTNISGYPHPPLEAPTLRQLSIDLYTTCAQCHQDKYEATLDSVHQKAFAAGNFEAAVCTDCHDPHAMRSIEDTPRTEIPQTCRQCHTQIYDLYQSSVHGEALIGEGNPDVPTCIDCHGVHNVEGPSTRPFHLFSPQICAECHADEELMAKYGVSTDVFETYLADFHGTTVTLFQAVAPDQETNKPVCIDCHGVHDMRPADDPNSDVIKTNLLATCQKCHPDATINFSDAWLSHYRPSPEHAPLVFYVKRFYDVLIPTVIGGMALFVAGDFSRRLIKRRREKPDG